MIDEAAEERECVPLEFWDLDEEQDEIEDLLVDPLKTLEEADGVSFVVSGLAVACSG